MEKRDRSEYFKEYREKNREKIRENTRNWQKNNKDKVNGYNEKYLNKLGNRDKMNERRRNHYQKTLEVSREKNRIRQANYRARKKAEKGEQ